MKSSVWHCLGIVIAVAALASPAGGATYIADTVSEIHSYVNSAGWGDEVVIEPGTYNLWYPLNMSHQGVTLRGQTGNHDDVILRGSGMCTSGVNEGICMNTNYLTVKDLTLKDFYYHAVHVRGENRASHGLISNVKTWNIGEHHLKVSGGGGASAIADDWVVEDCYLLQDQPRCSNHEAGPNYIGGFDGMGCRNWIVRDNVMRGIKGATDTGDAAIFFWQGNENILIERNRIYECGKGIGLGLTSNPRSGIFTYPYHIKNAIVRNNMVLRGTGFGGNDIALELCNTKDTKVYNNTFYSQNSSYFRTISPYDENAGGATSNLDIRANIIRGNVWDRAVGDWSIARLTADGNIVDTSGLVIVPTWFVDWTEANLHLAEASTAAGTTPVNAAAILADALEDFDRTVRGNSPDIGADEIILIGGDATLDWRVELADLSVLAFHFDTPAGMKWNDGDFNGDSAVTLADLSILAFNWGVGVAPPVPEPTTLSLLLAAGLAIRRRRRRA